MILGIGIDLIETERVIAKITRNPALLHNVFSEKEISYCENTADKAQHFAVRFAAKEALLKALGTGINVNFDLKDIEIEHLDSGAPVFNFNGQAKAVIDSLALSKIHVSLSHIKSTACAVVILEKE